MLKGIINDMQPIRKDAVMLIVSNPVDILTHIAQKLSGLPKSQVFGTGTWLDSLRLHALLASILKVYIKKHIFIFPEDINFLL